MKILWLCNVVLPQVADKLNISRSNKEGWLSGIYRKIIEMKQIELIYLFPCKDNNLVYEDGNALFVSYDNVLSAKVSAKQIVEFEKILEKHSPDVIHIFGTEYTHSLAMVRACKNKGFLDRTVISIQGMVSVCANHYYAYMPESEIRKFTFRDFLRWNNIYHQRENFKKRGSCEEEAVRLSKHIIGRTDWDYACVKRLNNDVNYHFCNETLRKSFYMNEWDLEKCEKHSIFVSQSLYPLKGFHLAIQALRDVLKVYPDAHLYTTGSNPLTLSIKKKLRRTYYIKYLEKLIKKYKLEKNITFLGGLNEEQMCERFLKSHVFLSPSSIENSPNSVGEAMILGVPTISSDVGGVKNQINHNENGYVYQPDAPYMAAHYIMKIFENDELAKTISDKSKKSAKLVYDAKANLERLLEIYLKIAECDVLE